MIKPDRFKEMCDSVFENRLGYPVDTLCGYKPVYDDETGEFLGNNLLFQGFIEDLLLHIGPIVWGDDYFQSEEEVETFAESVLEDIWQRLS